MMTLWGRKSSINVQKVLWVLAELGLDEGSDFKQIDAGLHFGINKTPDYLKLNPNGLVPTLEDGALVLWESNTIMRYLAKKYDSNNAFPDDLASQASSEKLYGHHCAFHFLALLVSPRKNVITLPSKMLSKNLIDFWVFLMASLPIKLFARAPNLIWAILLLHYALSAGSCWQISTLIKQVHGQS
jgi:hypothetical protein